MEQQEKVFVFKHSEESEIEQFKAMIEGLVSYGTITRKGSETSIGLDGIKDHLRPIAEAELDKQGK